MSLKSSCYSKSDAFPPLQDAVMRIYSMRFCPYAQRTRLVLEHKQIPYETVNIDLSSKPQWLLDRNPSGKVPVLEKGDTVLYESTATSEWLDDMYPQPPLAPSDPYRKAWDRILLEYFGKVTSLYYGKLGKEDTFQEAGDELLQHYAFYENALSKRGGPFFGGESPSLIDFYLWPHMERLPMLARKDARLNVTKANFPGLASWYSVMYELPAVKATALDIDSHAHFITTFRNGKPDFNYGL